MHPGNIHGFHTHHSWQLGGAATTLLQGRKLGLGDGAVVWTPMLFNLLEPFPESAVIDSC